MSPVTLVTVDGSERELLECSVWGLSSNQGQAMILKVKLLQSRSRHDKVTPWQSRSNYHNQVHAMTRSNHGKLPKSRSCHDKVRSWQSQTTTIKVMPWQGQTMTKSNHRNQGHTMTRSDHDNQSQTTTIKVTPWHSQTMIITVKLPQSRSHHDKVRPW